ncbi:MAG: hypothetical protein ACPHQP_02715 [Longimicrobiales bacterium]
MTKTMRWISRTALVAVVVGGAACDDATSIESLDDTLVIDAAMVAADATIEEARMWREPFLFGSTPALSAPGDGPHSTAHSGGRRSWSGSLERSRSVVFYDEGGAEQDAYDPLTTDEIHIDHAMSGLIERERFTAQIDRERSMIVSGLAGEEAARTWNGSSESSVARSGVLEDGTERSHSMSGAATYTNIVVPIPGTEPRYPLSGTISRSMLATRTTAEGTSTREVTVVITFNGTQYADATVNGDAIEIDLAAEDGRRPFRRKRGG